MFRLADAARVQEETNLQLSELEVSSQYTILDDIYMPVEPCWSDVIQHCRGLI